MTLFAWRGPTCNKPSVSAVSCPSRVRPSPLTPQNQLGIQHCYGSTQLSQWTFPKSTIGQCGTIGKKHLSRTAWFAVDTFSFQVGWPIKLHLALESISAQSKVYSPYIESNHTFIWVQITTGLANCECEVRTLSGWECLTPHRIFFPAHISSSPITSSVPATLSLLKPLFSISASLPTLNLKMSYFPALPTSLITCQASLISCEMTFPSAIEKIFWPFAFSCDTRNHRSTHIPRSSHLPCTTGIFPANSRVSSSYFFLWFEPIPIFSCF